MGQRIGKFMARGTGTPDLGESRKQKTPFIGSNFEVIDHPKNPPDSIGKTFEFVGYLTDATAERTTNAYKTAGCKDAASFDFTGFGSKIVEIDVENDGEFGPRVAWVNEPSAGGVDDKNRIVGQAKTALAKRLKMMLNGAQQPAQNGAAALGKAAADPFAVKAPANGASNDAAQGEPANEGDSVRLGTDVKATGTDNIPF